MFHTASLSIQVPLLKLKSLLDSVGFSSHDYVELVSGRSKNKTLKVMDVHGMAYPGLKELEIYRVFIEPLQAYRYFCWLKIEPLMMIRKKRTVELFEATPENINLLEDVFLEYMSRLLGKDFKAYHPIRVWACKRLDISYNLLLANSLIASDFIQLTKRRNLLSTHKANSRYKYINCSNSAYSKSSKVILYDKERHIADTFTSISGLEAAILLLDAGGTVRFELQCKQEKLRSIRDKHGIEDKSILPLLDETIANEQLSAYYRNTVGFGDFYIKYHAEKAVKTAKFSVSTKEKLLKTLRLIAISRDVKKAMKVFTGGRNSSFSGTEQTFRSYLKKLDELGINYVMIPKEWPAQHNYKDSVKEKIPNPAPAAWRESEKSA